MSVLKAPLRVFCSSAPEDTALCQQLHNHLCLLEREGTLTFWHDRLITAGTDWAQVVDIQIKSASIILLLISPAFLVSDYCYGLEMQTALQRHQAHQARVIPILLRPTDWKVAPFAHLSVLPTNKKSITQWRNRDAAFADVTAGLRSVIEELSQAPLTASAQIDAMLWNVPYPRNIFFIGREDLLATLEHTLTAYRPTALSQPQAMSGLGGVGKTQLAVEYAYRHLQDYEAVFWVPAANRETLFSGFVTLADLLQLPQRYELDQSKSVEAVKQWLQRHSRWLLILDNADDLSLLPDFLPPLRSGHLLLTTRTQSLGGLANRIEVNTLDQSSGTLLLLHRAGLLSLEADLSQAKEAELLEAQQLWQELGGLPLALDQAAAYIEETQCGLSTYLNLFRSQRTELLRQRGGVLRDHPDSVYTTFTMAITTIAQYDATAVELLQVCALLHPDAIPEELFRQGASYLSPALESACTNSLVWNRLLGRLCSYSLLKRQPQGQTFSIHRLVQMVLFDTLTEQERMQWISRIIVALDHVFSQCEQVTWIACERLVPHVLNCASHAPPWDNTSLDLASLLYRTANYLASRGQFRDVKPLYERVLHIREQVLGPDHPDVVGPLGSLSFLHYRQEEYEQSMPLLERVLHIQEQTLGPDHPDVAGWLQSLASDYAFQGKMEQAVSLYRRALRIWEQVLASDDPDKMDALTGLALYYLYQGKYEQAEPLYQRALHIQEQTLGPEHHELLSLLENLAYLSFKRGKMDQAELLYQRLLPMQEQIFGSDRIHLAPTLHYLGKIYSGQGKYEQAEPLYQRALHIRERVLGAHSHTAETLHDLAALKEAQGRTQEAAALYQYAQTIREHALKAPSSKTVRGGGYGAMIRAAASQLDDAACVEGRGPDQADTEEA